MKKPKLESNNPQRLSSKEWGDVADLLNECASLCETAYESHEKRARQYAAAKLFKLACWAENRAAMKTRRLTLAPATCQA